MTTHSENRGSHAGGISFRGILSLANAPCQSALIAESSRSFSSPIASNCDSKRRDFENRSHEFRESDISLGDCRESLPFIIGHRRVASSENQSESRESTRARGLSEPVVKSQPGGLRTRGRYVIVARVNVIARNYVNSRNEITLRSGRLHRTAMHRAASARGGRPSAAQPCYAILNWVPRDSDST